MKQTTGLLRFRQLWQLLTDFHIEQDNYSTVYMVEPRTTESTDSRAVNDVFDSVSSKQVVFRAIATAPNLVFIYHGELKNVSPDCNNDRCPNLANLRKTGIIYVSGAVTETIEILTAVLTSVDRKCRWATATTIDNTNGNIMLTGNVNTGA